ncbi:membrane protein [Candidatus Magnetobacterium bavaricum]|uniref:Membrane protein n=1 Tax=Candidatus Magnetobacterium bavaricum TaxID=29290 RepID=A0A0F3GKM1_9BACT|nr:membrane protein [Candidatus Magnetobacterium bavaricum]
MRIDGLVIQGIALIVIGALISIGNWVVLIGRIRSKRFISTVPILGALFIAIGMLFIPGTRRYFFMALLVDFGTIELLYHLPEIIIREVRASRQRRP